MGIVNKEVTQSRFMFLDELKVLECQGDIFVARVLAAFIVSSKLQLSRLINLGLMGDISSFSKEVLALRLGAMKIGASRLAALCERIENEPDLIINIDVILSRLQHEVNSLIEEIKMIKPPY